MQRPLIWLQFTQVSFPDLNQLYTFQGEVSSTMDAAFGVKKWEARLMASVDRRIDDNKKLLERLERL